MSAHTLNSSAAAPCTIALRPKRPRAAAWARSTGTGPQQLWVSRLDMSLLPADPSAPAVWLPGQEPFTGNLTAEWTVDF